MASWLTRWLASVCRRVAPVSLALRRLTGSWGTQFVLGAIAWCLCGVWYTRTLSLTPARELLA